MSDIAIRVLGGLPAIARVSSYYPYHPATWNDPPEGPEVNFEILDRRGRPAPWIEKRMTEEQMEAVEIELLEICGDAYRNRKYADL